VSIDINETMTKIVLEVMDNSNLSGVIAADDIADVVREIVDSDYISENVDYNELANNVEERLDLDYVMSRYLCDSGYIQGEDVSEYVVNELDGLLSDYSYTNTCRTWRHFIQAVEDIIDHKVVQADDAHVEDEGTVRSVVRDEMKRMLGEPIRQMIYAELATHAIRGVAQNQARVVMQEMLPEINQMAKSYVELYVNEAASNAFNTLIKEMLREAFHALYVQTNYLQLPEPEAVLTSNGAGA
jgi:citrate lyase gamma subunit